MRSVLRRGAYSPKDGSDAVAFDCVLVDPPSARRTRLSGLKATR